MLQSKNLTSLNTTGKFQLECSSSQSFNTGYPLIFSSTQYLFNLSNISKCVHTTSYLIWHFKGFFQHIEVKMIYLIIKCDFWNTKESLRSFYLKKMSSSMSLFTSGGTWANEVGWRIGADVGLESLYHAVVTKRELSNKAKLSFYGSSFVPIIRCNVGELNAVGRVVKVFKLTLCAASLMWKIELSWQNMWKLLVKHKTYFKSEQLSRVACLKARSLQQLWPGEEQANVENFTISLSLWFGQ